MIAGLALREGRDAWAGYGCAYATTPGLHAPGSWRGEDVPLMTQDRHRDEGGS